MCAHVTKTVPTIEIFYVLDPLNWNLSDECNSTKQNCHLCLNTCYSEKYRYLYLNHPILKSYCRGLNEPGV